MDDLLRITTLGGLSVQCNGQPVRGFVSRKVEALLVYLAANPREHPREVLGELLWDDLPQNRTMSYLRTALSSLQQQLAPYLTVSRQTLSINLESSYWLDIHELERVLDEAETEWEQREGFSRLTASKLEGALELYQGHFLEGFHIRDASGFEGWMVLEQERIRNRVLDALHRLGSHYLRRGQYSSGIAHVTRALQLDPLSEHAYRLMMNLLAHSGQRSAAITQYEQCRQILDEELGVEPEEETIELYEQILAGEISAETQMAVPHNLPTPATPFVDRPNDLRHIIEQLDRPECRLLTLVGAGGIGKTRLALEAASQLLPEYNQGIYFVAFAPVTDPFFIARTIANTLNITFKGDAPLEDELIKHLRNQEMLLILDNFDHLVAGADVLSRILSGAPAVKLLVTSRERLNLQEEWLFSVEALKVPASAEVPNCLDYPAIQLFVQAVQRVQPDFSVNNDLASIVRICQLVEGMPLGIELAASWVRMMTTAQIIEEIKHSLDFLTTTLRNIPERHRSIRAVFDSSWNMLDDEEQRVLRQLSVFRGGFQPDAARSITGASLLTLSALVDKSLLSQDMGRYQIHELLRQYAMNKLDSTADEPVRVRAEHSKYFATFLADRESRLTNNRSDSAYGEVLQEIDNVASGWQFALESGDRETMGRFLRPLYRLLDIQSRYIDGEQLFRLAAEKLGGSLTGENDVVQARALLLRAACLQSMAQYDEAEPIVTAVLPVFRREDALWESRIALACMGGIAYARGEYRKSQEMFEEVYDLVFQTGGDPVIILLRLSDIATVLGEYEKARRIMEDALSFLEDGGGQQSRMRFLLTLGDINCKLGHFDEAQANFQEAFTISETLKAHNSGAVARVSLARVALGMGSFAEAREYCRQSIAMFESIRNQWGKAFALIHLGKTACALENYAEAKHHYRIGLQLADQVGSPWLTTALLRQLSRATIYMGNLTEAKQHALNALKNAVEIYALPLVMDALVGIAELNAHQQNLVDAAELAAFVRHQPYSEYETLRDAGRIDEQARAMLSAQHLEAAEQRAQNLTLEQITARLLKSD